MLFIQRLLVQNLCQKKWQPEDQKISFKIDSFRHIQKQLQKLLFKDLIQQIKAFIIQMLEKLNLRRQSQRSSIRKEQKAALFQKRRLELIQSQQQTYTHNNQPYISMMARANNQQGFNINFFQELMEFSVEKDSEKGYILLGNYIIDHNRQSIGPAFEFFIRHFSERSYYAWVVRLILEAQGVDRNSYLHQIDRFIISADLQTIHYGLSCANCLIEKQQFGIVLKLPHLRYLVKQLTNHADRLIRRQSNDVLLSLLTYSESARQVLVQSLNINLELCRLLTSQSSTQKKRALEVILIIFQRSLCTLTDLNLFKELAFLYYSDNLQAKITISKIYLEAAQSTSLVTLCQMLECGMKNVLWERVVEFEHSQELVWSVLRGIEVTFQRFDRQGEHNSLFTLKQYLETKFKLSDTLLHFQQSQNQKIQQTACRILNQHYSFAEVEENLLSEL